MNKNNVIVADSDERQQDIALYAACFEEFLQDYTDGKNILPEITEPILAANKAGDGILKAILCAYVAGLDRGLGLALAMDEEISNKTIIE